MTFIWPTLFRKLEVLNEVLHGGIERGMEELQEIIANKIKALNTIPTATDKGFIVGKVYRLKGDNRCTYHIVCETHYTAVYRDGSHAPVTAEICNLGTMKDDYELETPTLLSRAESILPGGKPVPKLAPHPDCTCGADYIHGNQCPLFGGGK